jgi:hypothetical protein
MLGGLFLAALSAHDSPREQLTAALGSRELGREPARESSREPHYPIR